LFTIAAVQKWNTLEYMNKLSTNDKQLNLIVQYYRCSTAERQEEINTCLRMNLLNPCISELHLLTEEVFDFATYPNNEKIHQINIHSRLTFEHAFAYANKGPVSATWILSNADIYFDGSLIHLNGAKLDDTVFALTRHDIQKDGTWKIVDPAFAHGCQDAWIFKTPLPLDILFAKFYLGIPGCDNRIAYEFINAGYKVINPSNKISIFHLDLIRDTNIFERDREYAKLMSEVNIYQDLVAPPPYQYHIYPVDQVDPNSFEMYKSYISNLTRLGSEITTKEQKLTELYSQLNIMNNKFWRVKIKKALKFIFSLFYKQGQ
jgi:hypothetical protein